MNWKLILVTFAIVVIVVSFPLFNKKFLLMFDGKGHFKYSNSNASFTHEESLAFKDPHLTDWPIKRFNEETNPAVENQKVYRLYKINPLCFWRWSYYIFISRNFKYKPWKDIEPDRISYSTKNIWQDF